MNTTPENWTGERLETFILSENTNEHLHRYAMALELAAGKNVLDIACGEGYGSHLMADTAGAVTGVDIDESTVKSASEKYRHDKLKFLVGSAAKIPCADHSFDLVVSFETIEHHDQHEEMMSEIKRVLKPDGILLISSPDKKYYSDEPGYKNPYHVKELYKHEFEALLKKHFPSTHFYAQKSITGSVIFSLNDTTGAEDMKQYSGDYSAITNTGMQAVYGVALASAKSLPVLGSSLFNGQEVLTRQIKEMKDYAVYIAALEAAKNATEDVRRSREYLLGAAIQRRLSAIKKFFHV